ncbi:acetyl-CoA carboxylase biotin carboxyl carrier protein subunit, partial [Melaminivora alkalimesophila]
GAAAAARAPATPTAVSGAAGAAPGDVLAPLAGSLVAWHKAEGEEVQAGEVLATMEAMKMETALSAPCAGRLQRIAQAGQMVAAGELVARIRTGENA